MDRRRSSRADPRAPSGAPCGTPAGGRRGTSSRSAGSRNGSRPRRGSLCPNLSVAENVFADRQPLTGGWLGLVDREALHARTAELLERFRLDIDPALEVGRLSAAMQQLVEILKAISLEPRVIVLDEPTSSLTTAETELLFENMRRMKAEGISFIYVSHHLPEVFEITDRVTVLRDGRHVHTCATDEIDERELVRRMVGRELADLYGARSGALGDECLSVEGARHGGDVRGVSLSVRKGEIVGLAGLAGAGRTELARGIFGAPALEAGRIRLEGREVTVGSPSEAIALGIGYLTEDRKEEGLFLDMSVRANCAAAARGATARSARRRPSGCPTERGRGSSTSASASWWNDGSRPAHRQGEAPGPGSRSRTSSAAASGSARRIASITASRASRTADSPTRPWTSTRSGAPLFPAHSA